MVLLQALRCGAQGFREGFGGKRACRIDEPLHNQSRQQHMKESADGLRRVLADPALGLVQKKGCQPRSRRVEIAGDICSSAGLARSRATNR